LNVIEIPKARIQEGIDLCKTNIIDFLNDAKLMIAEKRLNHAYVSIEFAIEEFGKAIMLRESLESSTTDPVIVRDSVFKSHKGKSEKAWSVLDSKFKTIYDEGYFDEAFFDFKYFETNTKASHDTRLQCAFVDYDGHRWFIGRNIKEKLLNELINHIESKIASF
jgi:AbiV family abortive infection protein